MKNIFLAALICLAVISFLGAASAQTMIGDINNDGNPDLTYYHEEETVTKAEADTNFDGKPDVTVHMEDGKFKSAEADTDYDGKPDKKFSDVAEFNKWLNEDRPQFKDSLGFSEDGTFTAVRF